MAIATTIEELISNSKDQQISYRNLHDTVCIKNADGELIKIPFNSLTTKYRDFLEKISATITLSEAEQIKYRFKPKLMSLDFYKTTELWFALLEINNLKSVIDFKPKEIKVFDPSKIMNMLNEILILEEKIE